jgi:hypothetical protein
MPRERVILGKTDARAVNHRLVYCLKIPQGSVSIPMYPKDFPIFNAMSMHSMEWGDTTGAYRNLPNNAKCVLLHPLRYVNDPAGFLQTLPTCHQVGSCILDEMLYKRSADKELNKATFRRFSKWLEISRSENMSNLVISGYPKA